MADIMEFQTVNIFPVTVYARKQHVSQIGKNEASPGISREDVQSLQVQRLKRGMSQHELAMVLNVKERDIKNLEKGISCNAKLIERALEVTAVP